MRTLFILICLILAAVPTRAELPELLATLRADTNKTVFGHLIEPAGDQNGDGFDDILVGSMTRSIFLYFGGDPMDTSMRIQFDNSGGDRLNNIGDVNGDGYDDILTVRSFDTYIKQIIYFGGPGIDTTSDLILGTDLHRGNWPAIRTADINGNGTDEIVSICNLDWSIVFYEIGTNMDSIPDLEFSPGNMRYPADYRGLGEGLVTGDFNGDNSADLAFNVRNAPSDLKNGEVQLYWGGTSFDTIADLVIEMPGEFVLGNSYFGKVLVCPGDINNDGYDDLYIGDDNSSDSLSFIYFGGPDIDDIPDILINDKANVSNIAGDLNNDGYPDLITSYPIEFSGIGHVHIYYGGPDVDSISDMIIRNSDMPQYQTWFGRDCSGVGDINGDGVDDFALSALQSNYGEVYIFSGLDLGTSADEAISRAIPEKYFLSHNFPNPFNPSTTISFDLPKRSDITLKIYNILGHEIKTLIQRSLAAGKHTVEWNGTDQSETPVSSGVYFYKLSTDSFIQSRKMLLLK